MKATMAPGDSSAREFVAMEARPNGPIQARFVQGETDNRKLLSDERDADTSPWRSLCQLVIEFPRRTEHGTGWFVGRRAIATSGHCVFSATAGGWARRVTVRLHRGGDATAGPEFQAVGFDATAGLVNSSSVVDGIEFDYGVIWLENDAGRPEIAMDYGSTAAAVRAGTVVVAGFPVPSPSHATTRDRVFFHAQKPSHVDHVSISYTIDTSDGQSGAPVLSAAAGDNVLRAVGIHASGFTGRNFATRIRPDVAALYRKWVEEGPP